MDASFEVKELTSAIYTADIVDEAGDPLAASILDSLELTLYDINTGTILNGRDHLGVLNNGQGVTLDEAGLLTWVLAPDDNVIVTDRAKEEVHVAVFDFKWASGTRRFWHQIELRVQNQRKLTA